MSFRRAQSRSVNRNTYLDNRLTTFTNPPIYTGDLYVERDETVGGNLTVGKNLRADSYYASGNFYLDNYILVPPGTIIVSAAINAPNGWLNCDGNVYAKAMYLDLFDTIGQTYIYDISYDQVNYFRVPDLRGRVVIGAGDNGDAGISNRVFSDKGGAETHTLTTTEMPSHNHSGTTDTSGNHTHTSNATGGSGSGSRGLAYFDGNGTPGSIDGSSGEMNTTTSVSLTINAAGTHAHTFTTGYEGGGAAHNNMQPFIVLRYLIKF
jgi:microcystin-dependent protein